MRNTRLPGHGLYAEGKAVEPDDTYGYQLTGKKTGRALCACGATSPEFRSDNHRKAWHREHKAEVRRQQESGNG